MDKVPSMQNLGRWLLAQERCETNPSDTRAQASVRVCEKLRMPLSTLAGIDGYKALLSRALTLAKAEVPSLGLLKVREDGSLEVLDPVGSERDMDEIQKGDTALVAQLLELLATFIGVDLTMQLVRDVWPDAPYDGIDSEKEKP